MVNSRVLTELSRTEEDLEATYKKFLATKSVFKQQILKSNAQVETKLQTDAIIALQKSFNTLDHQVAAASASALQATSGVRMNMVCTLFKTVEEISCE